MNPLLKALAEKEVISQSFDSPPRIASDKDKRNYRQVSGLSDDLIAYDKSFWVVKLFGEERYLRCSGNWKETFFPEATLISEVVEIPNAEEITQGILDLLTSGKDELVPHKGKLLPSGGVLGGD